MHIRNKGGLCLCFSLSTPFQLSSMTQAHECGVQASLLSTTRGDPVLRDKNTQCFSFACVHCWEEATLCWEKSIHRGEESKLCREESTLRREESTQRGGVYTPPGGVHTPREESTH